jgi:hypothetical protein
MRSNDSENYAKVPLKQNNVEENEAKQHKKHTGMSGTKHKKTMNDIIEWEK